MPRNLDRRVELLVPVEDKDCHRRLIEILDVCFIDSVKGKVLNSDGSYSAVQPESGTEPNSSQKLLFEQAAQAVKEAARSRRTMFQPHRAPSSET